MQGLVLIVEDDRWQAEVIERELERSGFATRWVSSVFAAIDEVDEVLPHAIILDIGLPATNGLALIHEVRSHADLTKIPIIICSNMADRLPTSFMEDYVVAEVLDKARIVPGDIAAAVKKVLDHGQ